MSYVLMALLAVGGVWAQDEPNKEEPKQGEEKKAESQQEDQALSRMIEQLKRRLELTDEQADQLKGIVKEAQAELKKVRENMESKIKETLGEEKLRQMQRFIDGLFGGFRPGRGGPGGFGNFRNMGEQLVNRMKEALNLSDEQVEKAREAVKGFNEKVAEMFRTARENGPEGFREAMENMRKEWDALAEKLKEGLSEEQKSKFDELVKQFRDRFGGRRGQDNRPEENKEEKKDDK